MNIVIFETEHFEVTYPMIRILDTTEHALHVFVYEESFLRLKEMLKEDMHRFSWTIKPPGMAKRRFIWQLYLGCRQKQVDLVFLNTVSAQFMLYGWLAAMLPRTRVIVTLHDANNFLRPRLSLNFRRLIRYLGKKFLAGRCHAYNLISETVYEHIKTSYGVKKPFLCIPGAIYEQKSAGGTLPANGPIYVVVPGTIDRRRRNYDQVFALLDAWEEQNKNLVIVLLGVASGEYGKSVLEKCRQYQEAGWQLEYYDGEVIEQGQFDEVLCKAHFIWIPSVIETVMADGIREVYGLTKTSGNIFDAIRHAKPLLVPGQLAIPPLLEPSVFRYAAVSAIRDFLQTCLDDPAVYQAWADNALAAGSNYTVEKIRERIKPAMDNLLVSG